MRGIHSKLFVMKSLGHSSSGCAGRIAFFIPLLFSVVLTAVSFSRDSRADYRTLHNLNIDWDRLRSDISKQKHRDKVFDSSMMDQVLAEIDKSQVPVLLPLELISRYAEHVKSKGSIEADEKLGSLFNFVRTDGGVTSIFKSTEYDLVCRAYARTLLTTGTTVADLDQDSEVKLARNNHGGYTATFLRYGASHACEIMCRNIDIHKDETCITKEEIVSVTRELVPFGPVK